MNATATNIVELGDDEFATLLQLVGHRQATTRAGIDQDGRPREARRSLLERGLVQRVDTQLHLPLPLAAALVALSAPTVAIAVSFPQPTVTALGGVQAGVSGFGIRRDRRWQLWTAPVSEVLKELRGLVALGATSVRLTRQINAGRVEGVEVDARQLDDDPTELADFLMEATNTNHGPNRAGD